MKDTIPSVPSGFDPCFNDDAKKFVQRFKDKRETRDEKGFNSHFYIQVKSVYDSYLLKHEPDMKSRPSQVFKGTHRIIKARVNQLGAYLESTQKSGDDHQLLLFVLSLVFVDDENTLSQWVDPLDYQEDFLSPLKKVLRSQAREGFSVALPTGSDAQKAFIRELQQEITQLSLENADLKTQLDEALEGNNEHLDALQARLDASERLIAELEMQAKETATSDEVKQARCEVRALFKQRLEKVEAPRSSQVSTDHDWLVKLCEGIAPPAMVKPLLKTDVFDKKAGSSHDTSTTGDNKQPLKMAASQ